MRRSKYWRMPKLPATPLTKSTATSFPVLATSVTASTPCKRSCQFRALHVQRRSESCQGKRSQTALRSHTRHTTPTSSTGYLEDTSADMRWHSRSITTAFLRTPQREIRTWPETTVAADHSLVIVSEATIFVYSEQEGLSAITVLLCPSTSDSLGSVDRCSRASCAMYM